MFKNPILLPTLGGGGGAAVNGGTVAVGFFAWRYGGGGILWMAVRTLPSTRLSPAPFGRTTGLWPPCLNFIDAMAIGGK